MSSSWSPTRSFEVAVRRLPVRHPAGSRERVALPAAALLGILAVAGSCHGDGGNAVVLHPHDGEPVRIAVELATTPRAREVGLMYRDALPESSGMLFVFPTRRLQSFWMHNTRIPLDIAYIADDGRIVRIHRRTKPFSEEPLPSGAPVRFVLEVDGGFMERVGVGEGDRVELGSLADTPAR
jgi:uncharacterized protein